MTVALRQAFFANARGLTFEDSASVTWSFNANTNQLTATATGGGGGPVSANPSATIGLSAVNGSAATFMTSDSAPPLSQAIVPTWTGQHIFTPGSSETAIIVNTTVNNVGVSVRSGSGSGAIIEVCGDGSGTGNGLSITQTSVGAGVINLNFNAALSFKVNGTTRMTINADGGVVVGGATGGDEGVGTLNAQGLYVNGTAVLTTAVTSVGLSDGSTSPIYTISGSPVTTTGTLTFTLATQTANTVFAGPTTGGAAQPTFRALVAADVPSSILPGTFSGFANPTASVGLAAVNGSATTAMRSDGAPALSQAIAPTWTGAHIFDAGVTCNAPSSGNTFVAKGPSGGWAGIFQGNSSNGNSWGVIVEAGTTSADFCVQFANQANSATFLEIFGDGHGTLGASATSGLQWTTAGAMSMSTTLAVNGLLSAKAGITVTTATTTLTAGTASVAPLTYLSGTNLTAAVAGSSEYDGTNHYFTNETTSGRGLVPVEQYFHLAAAGGGITTIANFFGTTSNISLVSGAYYEIEIVAYFTMGSTGSVLTWTLTNSAAPTAMNLYYEMSPVTGIVAPPGTAGTMLCGQILNGVTAAQTVVTTSLTASSKQYARFRIQLKNGTGTSLKIQCAETTTTTALTPNIGSFWRCKRIPAGNVGTFAA